jgi:CTP-dependent riboflavin kinase
MTGPPGETEIQRLNPSRVSMILSATSWQALAPGTLNLAVDSSVIEDLGNLKPMIEESAGRVVYPSPFERIPAMRKAYWYYAATARFGESEEPVLVRRAQVPVPGVVELFAAVSLTDKFKLKPDDVVTVEIDPTSRAAQGTSV